MSTISSQPVGNTNRGGVPLVRDSRGHNSPIVHWGTVHNLAPTEGVAARNLVGFGDQTGIITLVVGGNAYFLQGDVTIVATVGTGKLLLAGERISLPVWKEDWPTDGQGWRYVSVISAVGAGAIATQIVEHYIPDTVNTV